MVAQRIAEKLNQKLNWSISDILFSLGFKGNLYTHPPAIQQIVCYHGVDLLGHNKYNARFLSLKSLENQFNYFREKCHVVSIEEFFNGQYHSEKPTISLTFDDGYQCVLYQVLPLLEKYNLPATFYITAIRSQNFDMHWADCLDLSVYLSNTSFKIRGEKFSVKNGKYISEDSGLDLKKIAKSYDFDFKKEMMQLLPGSKIIRQNPKLDTYWKLLDEREIYKLSQSGLVTIGSHAVYHNSLDQIVFQDAVNELITSKKFLEDIIQKEIIDLAYPDGTYSNDLVIKAYEIGYNRQVSVDSFMYNVSETEILKKRMTNNPYISDQNQLKSIIKGSY